MHPEKYDIVFLCHYREIDEKLKSLMNPKGIVSRGGCTVAVIKMKEFPTRLRWAISRCSERDTFSRKLGRVRALGRAESSTLGMGNPEKLSYFTEDTSIEEVRRLARMLSETVMARAETIDNFFAFADYQKSKPQVNKETK